MLDGSENRNSQTPVQNTISPYPIRKKEAVKMQKQPSPLGKGAELARRMRYTTKFLLLK